MSTCGVDRPPGSTIAQRPGEFFVSRAAGPPTARAPRASSSITGAVDDPEGSAGLDGYGVPEACALEQGGELRHVGEVSTLER
jgi:hypothetical protein